MKYLKNKYFIWSCVLTIALASFVLYRLGKHSIQFMVDGQPLVYEPITAFHLKTKNPMDKLDSEGKLHLPWGFTQSGSTMLKIKEKVYYFKIPKLGRIVHNVDTKKKIETTKYIWDFVIFTLNRN